MTISGLINFLKVSHDTFEPDRPSLRNFSAYVPVSVPMGLGYVAFGIWKNRRAHRYL